MYLSKLSTCPLYIVGNFAEPVTCCNVDILRSGLKSQSLELKCFANSLLSGWCWVSDGAC